MQTTKSKKKVSKKKTKVKKTEPNLSDEMQDIIGQIIRQAKLLSTGKTRSTYYLEEAARKLTKLESQESNS